MKILIILSLLGLLRISRPVIFALELILVIALGFILGPIIGGVIYAIIN